MLLLIHPLANCIFIVFFFHSRPFPKSFQFILAFLFTVMEINRDPKLLPNFTLGIHLCQDFLFENDIYLNTIMLTSGQHTVIPNYKCRRRPLMTVIGGLRSDLSINIANFLGIYKIPQVRKKYI